MKLPSIPKYRVRLFLSVDLVGSTNYKAGIGRDRDPPDDEHPQWVRVFRNFFDEFPRILSTEYERSIHSYAERRKIKNALRPTYPPRVFKYVGDEIIFCSRLPSIDHAVCHVEAFLATMNKYGDRLDAADTGLDVKGTGWTASFPAPNLTIDMRDDTPGRRASPVSTYEELEVAADKKPSSFDFVGREMDSGFRLTRHARPDQMALSTSLALLLSKAGAFDEMYGYHGLQRLKGVIGGRPYPIISLDSERNSKQQNVRRLEQRLSGRPAISCKKVHDFLKAFIDAEDMEPVVLGHDHQDELKPPPSYETFAEAWQTTLETERERQASESEAADESDGDGQIPRDSEEFMRSRTRSDPPEETDDGGDEDDDE